MYPRTADRATGRTPARRSRLARAFATAAFLLFALAACGGGGSSPATAPIQNPPGNNPPGNNPPGNDPPGNGPTAPVIDEFTSDKAAYFIGERATLTVRFSGGTGRIEPNVGPVQSGQPVQTEALDGARELRLVVESTQGGAVSRTLRLAVDYRDRYREIPMRFASRGHTATLADDGKVLLIGGSRGQGTLAHQIVVYDPASGGFREIGQMRNGRSEHTATRLTDGRILVVGGETSFAAPLAEVVDERTGAVTTTGEPSLRRVQHAAVHLGNGRVLLTGGITFGENAPFGVSNTAEIWDASTGTFRSLTARMTARRVGHTAMLLPDARVLIVGGLTAGAGSYALAEIYDPRTETFTPVPVPDGTERGGHAAVQLADGSVLALGGENSAGLLYDTVVRFRPDGTGAETIGRLLRPRTLVAAAIARDGRVFLFGGETGTPGSPSTITNAAESYTPQGGATPIAMLPLGRSGHTVTRLRDGRLLIVGGEAGSNYVDQALIYE